MAKYIVNMAYFLFSQASYLLKQIIIWVVIYIVFIEGDKKLSTFDTMGHLVNN